MKRQAARGPSKALPGLFVVAIAVLLTGASPVFGHGGSVERAMPAPVEGPPPLCGGTITIPDSGPATPYPSTCEVSGRTGVVTEVLMSLDGLSHAYPDDIDILLVGPGGQNATVMSDAGGFIDATNVTIGLDDAAGSPLPDSGQLVSGIFQPTNFGVGDLFPAPAPTPREGSALSIFNGTNPNGTWSLYVVDDRGGDFGSISAWGLVVIIGPPPPPPPPPPPAPVIGPEFSVSDPPSSAQVGPRLAFDGTNYLAAWREGSSAVLGGRVDQFGNHLDGSGVSVGAGVEQAVAFDGTNYFVVWNTIGGPPTIRGARVSTGGVVVDPAGIPIRNPGPYWWPTNPDVAFNGSNYFVVWQEQDDTAR